MPSPVRDIAQDGFSSNSELEVQEKFKFTKNRRVESVAIDSDGSIQDDDSDVEIQFQGSKQQSRPCYKKRFPKKRKTFKKKWPRRNK